MDKDGGLKSPTIENTEIIYHAEHGRCMVRRIFKPPKGAAYTHHLWWHLRPPSSIVFPLTTDRNVVAIREFRHGMADFSLEFPGGSSDIAQMELPEETAKRELLEETGYKANWIIKLACDPWIETQSMNLRYHPFLAFDCTFIARPTRDETEIMETLLIPIEKWYEMVFAGQIVSNCAIAHSLLALPYLLREKIKFI